MNKTLCNKNNIYNTYSDVKVEYSDIFTGEPEEKQGRVATELGFYNGSETQLN